MNDKNKQAVLSSVIAGIAGGLAVYAPLNFVHNPHAGCLGLAVGVLSFVLAIGTTYYPEE